MQRLNCCRKCGRMSLQLSAATGSDLFTAQRARNVNTTETIRAVKVCTDEWLFINGHCVITALACALIRCHQINGHNATWNNRGRKHRKAAALLIDSRPTMSHARPPSC